MEVLMTLTRAKIHTNVNNSYLYIHKYINMPFQIEDMEFLIVIYKALCFDVAQGRMNGAPNETRTHSCRFARLSC